MHAVMSLVLLILQYKNILYASDAHFIFACLLAPPILSVLAPLGPEGLFSETWVDNIGRLPDLIRKRAAAEQAA